MFGQLLGAIRANIVCMVVMKRREFHDAGRHRGGLVARYARSTSWRGYAPRTRGAKKPHTSRTITAPTIEPMNPAPCPA